MIKFLKGVRVLEYAVLFNRDQTGCLLADLGADVIKMEAPTVGDWMEIAPAQTSRWARRTARRTWRTIAICTPAGARVRRDTDPGVVGGQRSEQKLRVGPVAVFRPSHACRMACTGTSASADQRGEFEGARTDRPSPIGEIPPDGEEPLGPGVAPRSHPMPGWRYALTVTEPCSMSRSSTRELSMRTGTPAERRISGRPMPERSSSSAT
jgi:hypothetical protein